MKKYDLSFETKHWQCGDRCCDAWHTTVKVNGFEVGMYSDLFSETFDGLTLFMEKLNTEDQNLILAYSVELDEDGDLSDTISLNDTKLTNTFWAAEVYEDILARLKLTYRRCVYDLNWDIWNKEKQLVKLLEEDVIISKFE